MFTNFLTYHEKRSLLFLLKNNFLGGWVWSAVRGKKKKRRERKEKKKKILRKLSKVSELFKISGFSQRDRKLRRNSRRTQPKTNLIISIYLHTNKTYLLHVFLPCVCSYFLPSYVQYIPAHVLPSFVCTVLVHICSMLPSYVRSFVTLVSPVNKVTFVRTCTY